MGNSRSQDDSTAIEKESKGTGSERNLRVKTTKRADSPPHQFVGSPVRQTLDPAVSRILKRLQSSQRTNSSNTSRDTQESNQSSSINDAFCVEHQNMACCYGYLTFVNGAVFQGIICNRLDEVFDETARDIEDKPPATFLTKNGECLHGIWIFEKLQYELEFNSPIAVYQVDLQVLKSDSSVHKYKGPAHLVLKLGRVVLPLEKDLLSPEADSASTLLTRKDTAEKGKQLLRLTLENTLEEDIRYVKYPLTSPKNKQMQRQLTSNSPMSPSVHRDHRLLFFSLVGKQMQPSQWDDAINNDLHRTHFHRFLDRSPETAKEQLHSILKYLALAFPSTGYCQGMHCIAKFLLMFSEAPALAAHDYGRADSNPVSPDATKPTKQGSCKELSSKVLIETQTAFVLFAQLVEDPKYRLCELFDPSLSFLRTILGDIDKRIQTQEPVLYSHLYNIGLTAVVYATKWCLTLFTYYVDQDFRSVTNVWLNFLSNGWDAIVHIACACVICVKEYLLNSDSEEALLILSGTTKFTPHGILEVLFGSSKGQALLKPRVKADHRDEINKQEVLTTEHVKQVQAGRVAYGRVPNRRLTK